MIWKSFKCVRRILGQFYSVIKTTEGKLRFLFVTGITKFSQTGIFSELNITDDFSFASEYSALLGLETESVVAKSVIPKAENEGHEMKKTPRHEGERRRGKFVGNLRTS